MSFKGLILDQHGDPATNQPVPLRLVPLLLDWSNEQLLEVLSEGFDIGHRKAYLIKVHIYDGTTLPKFPRRSYFQNLRTSLCGKAVNLSNFPSDQFIWSDDLISIYSFYIIQIIGPDEALDSGMSLNWSPDTRSDQADIDACCDFKKILPQSIQNRSRVQCQYDKWCEIREQLIKPEKSKYRRGNGSVIESEVAREIAKTAFASFDHVRKMIREHCK